MLGQIARATLDLLLPPGCASCDAPVAAPGQLCGVCFRTLSFIAEPLCRACGLPFASQAQAGTTRLCTACTAAPPPWGQARGAFSYDAAAKRLILPFKHADRMEIAATLALHMQRAGARLLEHAELLVPVPLHRSRLLQRRYNQSAVLAAALARRTRIPSIPDALARTRATAPLAERTASQRSALLMGSIAVRPHRRAAMAGKRVVLIDDVLTSGATARACVHALLDAGAGNVDVLVASRVADPRTDTARPSEEEHADD